MSMIQSLAAVGAVADPMRLGGKAAALARLIDAGFSVPQGVVLTSAFFAPWFAAIQGMHASERHGDVAMSLPLSTAQRQALVELEQWLPIASMPSLAVRSSAIGEDSEASSFAGIYETSLGVSHDGLELAIRRCFSAVFHARACAYRDARGIAGPLAFAVVVQQQLDSEISGVGFSIDPVSNDHDHILIEANFGLGVSVVDGRSNPDRFRIDKADRSLLHEVRGAKDVTVRLAAHGGTFEHREDRVDLATLTQAQLDELTDLICRVERFCACPVDIEWAYAGGALRLLQARPIVGYIPLPDAMLTTPGARRRLYMDASLSKGMTSNRAFSVLGLDQVSLSFHGLIERWLGPVRRHATPEGLIFLTGGRMYVNLSDLLWLSSPKRLAKGHAATDTLTADILASVDPRMYRSKRRPAWLQVSLLWRLPRLFWRTRSLFGHLILAVFSPDTMHARYVDASTRLIHELRSWIGSDLPPRELQRQMTVRMADAFAPLMAALILGSVPPSLPLGKRRHQADPATLDALGRGTRGNVVVEMNMAMSRIARAIGPAAFEDLDTLAQRISERTMPAEVLDAWDAFVRDYAWRGPDEMDVANPRYGDDPRIALRQIAPMALRDACDLEALHAQHVQSRAQALTELRERLGPMRRWAFDRLTKLHDLFAGARDTPKHINVLCNFVIRRRALRESMRMVAAGRLSRVEEVFDLTFEDLRDAALDPGLDLRALCAERTTFLKRVESQVKTFPPVIDSRGRVLRPPEQHDAPGVFRGRPVSAGIVQGRARVLRDAGDGRIEPGDILVAYTTAPGWTPLFANAAAVVLEVGGVLQHGAVVAREFGKPCVVGIAGIVALLQDGEPVEVDGAAGTVRRLTPPVSHSPEASC